MRKIIIAGNWKMYKTQAESLEFLKALLPKIADDHEEREVVLCTPFTDLGLMSKSLHGTRVRLGAQNIHWADEGAFTGEISGAMLTEMGVRYVIVGHSERRQCLIPILCVGESKAQRDAGETEAVIFAQLEKDLVDIDQNSLVIAYEPIWAIGTGDTCDAAEANRVIGLIREKLTNKNVTIQYGGSVKPDNVDEIMAQPEIDGALVGGASLEAESFARLVNYV